MRSILTVLLILLNTAARSQFAVVSEATFDFMDEVKEELIELLKHPEAELEVRIKDRLSWHYSQSEKHVYQQCGDSLVRTWSAGLTVLLKFDGERFINMSDIESDTTRPASLFSPRKSSTRIITRTVSKEQETRKKIKRDKQGRILSVTVVSPRAKSQMKMIRKGFTP